LRKLARKLGIEDALEITEPVPHHAVAGIMHSAAVCVAPLALNDRNVVQGCCPIKVLEYMAAGKPIVAANLPVVRELVREDIDGLLFFPGDPADLARQVLGLLDDPAQAGRMGERAARRVRERFTWHASVKKLLGVYAGLTGRSPG
jgi:glycosyltransferase involved in cell wall biosynthesis